MPVADAFARLRGAFAGDVRLREPMARHTTFRIGGPADLFCSCETLADLSSAIGVLDEEDVPWTVLGRGSNVLVADSGYRGAVVVLGSEFRRHRFDEGRLEAGAGCVLAALVQEAFAKGLSGLEFAVGIPGTLGGALAMNAGTAGRWIESVVESVTLYEPERGLTMVRGSEVAWGYRTSGLPPRGVIVESTLLMQEGDPERIRQVMEANFLRRKKSQPLGLPSAGSVFVNPEGDSAGRLIEGAGLKGARIGDAAFSDVHANFIVNLGRATAADVTALVGRARATVRDVYGVELRPEIRFLGEFPAA